MHTGPGLINGSPERGAGHDPRQAAAASAGRGSDPDTDIRLTLPASAENVVLVRHVVAALAETLGLPGRAVGDIKLAVTEACTNVVRHAYAGAHGALEVDIQRDDANLVVVVTDRGTGMRPRPDSGGAGLGLPLIAAVADGLEIEPAGDSGSRLRMSFRRDG